MEIEERSEILNTTGMFLLDGKKVRNDVVKKKKKESEKFYQAYSRRPELAIIIVGSDGASLTYVKSKGKLADEVGIKHVDHFLPEDTSEDELLNLIESLNEDDDVDGILVQLPLPAGISEEHVLEKISAEKDVDGFSPLSMGRLLAGYHDNVPCTPKGIMRMLEYYEIPIKGQDVVIIGRSNIVGRPLSILMSEKGADGTVTLCHSKTRDIKKYTSSADIVVVAVGSPGFLTSDMVKDGCTIIDVGITRVKDESKKKGYRVVGDVDMESFRDRDVKLSPVPGGVGVMTVAMLMENTIRAALKRKGERI